MASRDLGAQGKGKMSAFRGQSNVTWRNGNGLCRSIASGKLDGFSPSSQKLGALFGPPKEGPMPLSPLLGWCLTGHQKETRHVEGTGNPYTHTYLTQMGEYLGSLRRSSWVVVACKGNAFSSLGTRTSRAESFARASSLMTNEPRAITL